MRLVLARMLAVAVVLAALCMMGIGASSALAAPLKAGKQIIPSVPLCSSTYLVKLDDKTINAGSGQLEVRLYRTQDSYTDQICDYFGEAIETAGPSGTLEATIYDHSCGGPSTNTVSSSGTASVDSPQVANGIGNYQAEAKIGNYSVITACTA